MLIDVLREKYPEIPQLRIREILVDKQARKVFCTVSLPDAASVAADIKNSIVEALKQSVPNGYYCVVSLKNDYFTELSFQKFIFEASVARFPVLTSLKKESFSVRQSAPKKFDVTVNADSLTCTTMLAADFVKVMTDFCRTYTAYEVFFSVCERQYVNFGAVEEQEKLVKLAVNKELLKPARYFDIEEAIPCIGKKITVRPMYIVDVREPRASCVICGTVSEKTIRASKNDANLRICKFTVSDASGGKMNAVIFVRFQIESTQSIMEATGKSSEDAIKLSEKNKLKNEKMLKKLMELYEGSDVLLEGKVVKSSFSGQLEFQAYHLSKCRISDKSRRVQFSKPAPDNYLLIVPEKYEEYLQESFTDGGRKKTSFLLKGKNFVILNVNCTGFSTAKDKLFAISAAKVSEGIFCESLFTYVNPEKALTEAQLESAKVSKEKLLLYPTVSEIIADVYKFCSGSILVGMNIEEAVQFLNYYAEPANYVFGNETVKQNDLISDLYDNSNFGKKANCSKLEDVAKSCRIEYDGSDFCRSKSIAAARCIVKLGQTN